MTNGYVYLILDTYLDVYKIGVTKNLALLRLKKLQTGNATLLVLRYTYFTLYPYRLETMLHFKYKDLNVLNEWYTLTLLLYLDFEKTCKELENTIKCLSENYYFNKELR